MPSKEDEGKTGNPSYLDALTEKQQTAADALVAKIRAQVKEEVERSTEPGTRPGFSSPATSDDIDHKRFSRYQREVRSDLSGQVLTHKSGGFLPPTDITEDERVKDLKDAITGGFNINLFPRGDIENFAVTRWAMATQRSLPSEGSGAFVKYAPWESQYYHACEVLASRSKAMGDMVSGQDGGFLAPEEWSQRFIDQLYPAMALSRLPLTRVPMGTRVTHVPRLNSAIAISYAAENAALTATAAQFQQVSFTARKQSFLVQVSNELIRDSNPAAEAILRNNATRYLAIDRDKQCLLGTGQAGAPAGLISQTNVVVSGGSASAPYATNAAPVFSDFNTAIYNVENLNASTNVPLAQSTCTGIVGPVVLKSQVMNMKDTTNNRPIYDFGINYMRGTPGNIGTNQGAASSGMLDGLFGVPTWVLTNILAGTANSRNVFFGDWQHLWIMERQDVEILSSNVAGTSFQNDQTWIRGIARYDVGVAHPEAFYVVNNA